MIKKIEINYNYEIRRKLIHLSSLWMPITIYFLEKKYSIILFSIVFTIVFLSEILRINNHLFGKCFNYFFGSILRAHENNESAKFTGSFYMCLGVLITLIFFTKIIAVTSISVMLISDTVSALIGRKFGKIKILSKSLEGLIAFITSGFITCLIIFKLTNQNIIYIISSFCGVITAGLIELISKDILNLDDNLSVVISCSIIMELISKPISF